MNVFILVAAIIFFVWALGGDLGSINMLALGLAFWALGMSISFVFPLHFTRRD